MNEDALNRVVNLIKSRPGAEIVEAGPNGVRFCRQSPLRTFEVIRDGGQGFRVQETTGFQTAGRSNEPSRYSARDIIAETPMIEWVTVQLRGLASA
jgi:hypothetical protein